MSPQRRGLTLGAKVAELAEAQGLSRAFALLWEFLQDGASSAKHPLHTCALATIDSAGIPQQRTMVLQAADVNSWQFRFHMDARSPKYFSSASNGKGDVASSCLFYDKSENLQVRASGRLELRRSDSHACREVWSGMTSLGHRCYFQPTAPSSQAEDLSEVIRVQKELRERAASWEGVDPSPAFAIGFFTVEKLEFLHLSHTGHRRAVHFLRENSTSWLHP